jgi:hypothetical protein
MARNKKNQSAAVRFGTVIKAILLCGFFAGAGVGYVWQKNQIYELGRHIKQAEIRLEELQRRNKIQHDHLAYLRSPRVLDARVRELKLGLVPPQPEQVWRLADLPPGSAPAADPQPARPVSVAAAR